MPPPLLGVNFSPRQAEWLGLDADETFGLLLNELRVRRFRISLYWNEIQPEPTRYDFSSIHRLLDRAEARGARVLLTVGLKAQRHPEYYPPVWLLGEGSPDQGGRVSDQPRMVAHLLLMLERAVALLADYAAIDSWQVENEPFMPAAGRTIGWRFDGQTLAREIDAVASTDPRHRPIVINHSSSTIAETGWLKSLRLADVLGQDLYTRKPAGVGPIRYVNPFSAGPLGPCLGLQSLVAARLGRRFWITELQAEPWERTSLTDLEPHQIGSISPELLERNLVTAAAARPERVYLWGAEWWLAMRERGDDRYWQVARRLFRELLV